MTNTTDASYWLNWRFLVCALFVLGDLILAALLIWKFEGGKKSEDESRELQQVAAGVLFKDEAWKTCHKRIHPAWLLTFRVFAFILLLSFIVGNITADGGGIFIFYTQWTFALVTIYFGIASLFSVYGCFLHKDSTGYKFGSASLDAEQGTYVAPKLGESENPSIVSKTSHNNEVHARQRAGHLGYLFQILYQTCAGAVVLTDVVFWLILLPFLTSKNFEPHFYNITMHSVNAVLLIDTLLNCMRFPTFRIAYFICWTVTYVVFQWIIHACVNLWWPYPFLDLSSSFAPIWYVGVGVLHVPCFGIFALVVKIKHFWLSRSSPEGYQGMR